MALKSRIPQIITELNVRLEGVERAGAEIIEVGAKARVPVDEGTLRDAIHTDSQAEGTYVIAGDVEAFYGHIIEHGGVNVPARPFLVPSFEAAREPIIALGVRALKGL